MLRCSAANPLKSASLIERIWFLLAVVGGAEACCCVIHARLSRRSCGKNKKHRRLQMSQNWTPPPPPAGGSATVPNYLVPAIISIFCCWPLAIPAIIFAVQVNNKVTAGDIAGAQDASKKAKMFSFIAIGLGLAGTLIYIIMIVFFGGLSMLTNR